MAEHAEHELIIVRRHEEEEHEAHSSAWKVAHADFMTAMMAFFLIMWLISVTDDQIRKGISEYFNPIRLSQGQTELKGLNKPTTDPNKPGQRKGRADAPADVFNPMKLSEGLSESKALEESEAAAAAPADSGAGASAAAAGAGAAPTPGASAAAAEAGAGTEAGEGAAFRNPYALLDDLAAGYRAAHPVSSSAVVGDDRSLGIDGSEVDRDPFDPVYWQLGTTPAARTETPGKPGTAKAPPDARPDAAAAKPAEAAGDSTAQAEGAAAPSAASRATGEAAPAAADTATGSAATASGVAKTAASPVTPAAAEASAAEAVAAATRADAAAIGAEVSAAAA
jgi:chemotaxis protein MotB